MWARKRQKVTHPPDGSHTLPAFHDNYYRRHHSATYNQRNALCSRSTVRSSDSLRSRLAYHRRNPSPMYYQYESFTSKMDHVMGEHSSTYRQHSPTTNPSTSTTLDVMPPEILHLICGLLKPNEVQRFRRICRAFAAVGLEHLGTEAYLCCKMSSFASLVDLSDSSLSKNITNLHFMPDRFSKRYTYVEWLATEQYKGKMGILSQRMCRGLEGMGRTRFHGSRDSQSHKRRHEAWFRFRQYYTEQAYIARERVQPEILNTFFLNCPKLTTVRLLNFEYTVEKLRGVFRDAFSWSSYKQDLAIAVRAFVDIMSAACQSQKKLKIVIAACLSFAAFPPVSQEIRSIQLAMQPLEQLALDLRHKGTSVLGVEVVHKLLGMAPNLHHLELALPESRATDFDNLVGCHTFHNLRSLQINCFTTTEQGLRRF